VSRRRERGQILPIVAVALVILMAGAAFLFDFAMFRANADRILDGALRAAALAALEQRAFATGEPATGEGRRWILKGFVGAQADPATLEAEVDRYLEANLAASPGLWAESYLCAVRSAATGCDAEATRANPARSANLVTEVSAADGAPLTRSQDASGKPNARVTVRVTIAVRTFAGGRTTVTREVTVEAGTGDAPSAAGGGPG